MDENILKKILVHQLNINIRLQEFIFDVAKTTADEETALKMKRILQGIETENKAMILDIFPGYAKESDDGRNP